MGAGIGMIALVSNRGGGAIVFPIVRFVPLCLLLLAGCARAESPRPLPQPAAPPQVTVTEKPYSVPLDTTDPVLVRQGVDEWLARHIEFAVLRTAVLRRMGQESGFEPCITNGPHKYLLQWRDERLRTLAEIAHTPLGKCPRWIDQMAHVAWELHHYPQFARVLHATPGTAYWLFSGTYLGGRM
jgi:hypothetical protein